MKDKFYVMTFDSTSHGIQTEKRAAREFRVAVIPTPRELSRHCGLAIRFADGTGEEKIKDFFKSLTVPATLYALSTDKVDGKRETEKIL